MFKVNFYCTMTKICVRIGARSMAHKFCVKACDESLKMISRLEKD